MKAYDRNKIVNSSPEELDMMYLPLLLNSTPSTKASWPVSEAASNGWVTLGILVPVT